MKPTPAQLQRLRQAIGDPEHYHAVFDQLAEEHLMNIDPEWMDAMHIEYENSRMSRWYS